MPITVVMGTQWGDEGKGKLVNVLAAEHDIVARSHGGHNAGHTISNDRFDLALHLLPSGITQAGTLSLIGNGVLLEPVSLMEEIRSVEAEGVSISPDNLAISNTANLIFPHHVALDELREEGGNGNGSTRKGISFAAAEKYGRENLQTQSLEDPDTLAEHLVRHLMRANVERRSKGKDPKPVDTALEEYLAAASFLSPFLTDTVGLLHDRLDEGATVLAEGAQSHFLDIEQSPYGYGTSSHTTVGGVLTGLSVGPQYFGDIFGVIKGVKSRVGDGPFITEIEDPELADRIRGPKGAIDSEYGSTTERPRRIGYLDIPELRQAQRVNGITAFGFNKLDKLPTYGKDLKVAIAYDLNGRRLERAPSSVELADCTPVYESFRMWDEPISHITEYEKLPPLARDFVECMEFLLGRDIAFIGVGPLDTQLIRR